MEETAVSDEGNPISPLLIGLRDQIQAETGWVIKLGYTPDDGRYYVSAEHGPIAVSVGPLDHAECWHTLCAMGMGWQLTSGKYTSAE